MAILKKIDISGADENLTRLSISLKPNYKFRVMVPLTGFVIDHGSGDEIINSKVMAVPVSVHRHLKS